MFFIGLSASAQTDRANVVTVTPFEADGVSYLHMQGRLNTESVCFDGVTEGDSYDVDYQGQGQDIDLFMNDDVYRVVYHDRASVNADIGRWAYYNKIYRVRAEGRPVEVENSNLLDCPDGRGWRLATGGSSANNLQWYVHPDYPGWAYNDVIRNGLYDAALTDQYQGFSASLNGRYLDTSDLGITFGGRYGNLAALEAAIETLINNRQRVSSFTWEETIQLSATGNFFSINGATTVGAHSYIITAPLQYGESVPERHGMGYFIEGSWIYHGGASNTGGNNTPNIYHRIDTPTYFWHAIHGEFNTEAEIIAAFPNGQILLDSNVFTVLHRAPTLQQVEDAQTIVRNEIRAQFDAFAASQVSGG